MNKQLSIFQDDLNIDFPELTISRDQKSLKYAEDLLEHAKLSYLLDKVEVWDINHSSKKLSYLTHNIFRFFGKFPPPIARHLIKRYTEEEDLVYDPMIGSGTTATEALLLNRRVICSDVSPLSKLLTEVKCQPLDLATLSNYLKKIRSMYLSLEFKPSIEESEIPLPPKSLHHWFLKETIESLIKILSAIKTINRQDYYKFFLACFISTTRKVSRATTQQGRLFLDIETAEKEAWPEFEKITLRFINSITQLPSNFSPPQFILSDIREITSLPEQPKLVICHPPYFNVYKFSTIFTLELAWLFVNRPELQKQEVREYFKIGKPDNVHKYVEDMKEGIINVLALLKRDTVFSLMIGDTRIHDNHIPTTSLLLKELKDSNLKIISLAIRRPKFTEASWVASQRRTGKKVGINLSDFIVTFKKN